MYYRVYGIVAGKRTQIDRTTEERDVVDTIGYYISNGATIDFIIIFNDGTQDIPYKMIHSQKDYVNYIQEVNERCKENVKRTRK